MKQTLGHLAPPGTEERKLPSFDELPKFHEMPGCAWDVWGKGDQLGTVNLLTEAVVKRAAQEEIQCAFSMIDQVLLSELFRDEGLVKRSR